jgi:hypothetical protein
VAENALLRQQLLILRREVARPQLTRRDRWWMVAMARVGPGWEYYLDSLAASREGQPLPTLDAYYPAQKAHFTSLEG